MTLRLLAMFALLAAIAPGHAQSWSNWKNRYRPADTQGHETLYRLPFDERAPVRVDQGPQGRFSHADAANRHAIDFALPEGTPVLAARDGVVTQVADGIDSNFARRPRDADMAGNFVRIRHDDGSVAVYAHLRPGGVSVRAGQRVRAGERIGLSGNTGYSTAPHLHFAVQLRRGTLWESIPVRIAGPRGELKFPAQR